MKKKSLLNINRRDFMNGVSLSIVAGATLSPMDLLAGQNGKQYYPPSLKGMRGSHAGSFEVAHSVAWQGKDWGRPYDQTDDIYDLIVVGGGISGLATAFLYQQKAGKEVRILILDNHDDFGGHAKRNEFDVDGQNIIGYGGSQTIEGPAKYSPEAQQLLKDISIETERFYDYFKGDFYDKWKLESAIYFDGTKYGSDKLVKDPFLGFGTKGLGGQGEEEIRSFPVSKDAQDALIKLLTEDEDHFPDLTNIEKEDKLRTITYVDYLQNILGMPKEATDIFRDRSRGVWGVGWDALSTLEAVNASMPGVSAYQNLTASSDGNERREPYIFHFPDGNAGVARALVRKLIPSAASGTTMEDLVTVRINYDQLDQSSSRTRIRLNSTAVDVRHTTDQKMVDVSYVRKNNTYRVRGKHVVMACYNDIVPHICPEVPEEQREAIAYATKVPMVYTNIALRNWRPFVELGCQRFSIANPELHHDFSLDFPVSMGDYEFSKNPDEPIIVHATYVPTVPDEGYSAREQHKMGRQELYQLTFDDFETSIVRQMNGMLGKGGFDAERDIAGITVNRWPHGYAYEYNDYSDPKDWGPEKGPHIAGRAQIGRISIANSDASGYAYVNGAIDAANRAVDEQINL
ncbi:MAG: NAD(P)-binding protein [Emcibacteraceae bacterium]|nr:NAD(P)-binding protein [Emcibacteraceae bacterium]